MSRSRLQELCVTKSKIKFIEKLLPKIPNGLHYYMDYFNDFEDYSDAKCAEELGITIKEGQIRILIWSEDNLEKKLKAELLELKAKLDFI